MVVFLSYTPDTDGFPRSRIDAHRIMVSETTEILEFEPYWRLIRLVKWGQHRELSWIV